MLKFFTMKKVLFIIGCFLLTATFSNAQIATKCTNTINLSTVSGWVNTGSPSIATTTTTFYGHSNWMKLTSPSGKTAYSFKRVFYVCRAGSYKLKTSAMGNNDFKLSLDGSISIISRNITAAAGFNAPSTDERTVTLTCGVHELNVSIADDGDGNSGFFVDATLTGVGVGASGSDGCLSNKPCTCEVYKEVCRCPVGWISNTTNIDGGITTDGKCKKLSCKPLNISPLPPSGTQLAGNIGFTWGDELWFYGTKENKGLPICKKEWITIATP